MPTLGSDSFKSANPDFGATFTYYLGEKFQTGKDKRREAEKSIRKQGGDVPFPGWDRLTGETLEATPRVMILVSDTNGNPVRWVEAANKKGTQRVSWDLRHAAPNAIDLSKPAFTPPWAGTPQGPLVTPGEYSAQLFAIADGQALPLGDAQTFSVKPVRDATDGTDYAAVATYQQETAVLMRKVANAREELGRTRDLLNHMKIAAVAAQRAKPSLFTQLDTFDAALSKLETRLSGDRVRSGLNENSKPSIGGRAYNAANTWHTTHAPTATQLTDFEIAQKEFADFSADLKALLTEDLVRLEDDLSAAGAPSWR